MSAADVAINAINACELDAQIAAITLVHGASLATRNVRDFENVDLDVINPWEFRG